MTADLDQLRQAAHAASVARQERDEAIRAAIADGAPLRAVATAAGLSVAGVARIRDRARNAKKPPVCSTSGSWHQVAERDLACPDHRYGCLTCSVVETDPYRRGVERAAETEEHRTDDQ